MHIINKTVFLVVLSSSLYILGCSEKVQSISCEETSNHDIVLYSTSWCGYCTKTRKLLAKNNVDYCEYDIEKSAEGEKQYDALGGGGIPVMSIYGTTVQGYDKQTILHHIKNH